MNRYDRNNSGSNFRGGRGRGLQRRGTGVNNSNENKRIKYDQGGGGISQKFLIKDEVEKFKLTSLKSMTTTQVM